MTDKTDSKEREAFVEWMIADVLRSATKPVSDEMRDALRQTASQVWDSGEELVVRGWKARASLAASAGSESVTNNRPSLESVFRGLSDRAYCDYIEQMRRNECLGWEHKVKHGTFGEAELKAHTLAGRLLGRHHAFAEAANALRGSDAPLTHPSPPEGMVMVPANAEDVRAFIGSQYETLEYGPQDGDEAHENDRYTLTVHDLLSAFRWWSENMQLTPPTTSAGSGKGD